MSRDEAFDSLRSSDPLLRLKAARRLARVAEVVDLGTLRDARAHEDDSWVRHALDMGIERLDGSGSLEHVLSSLPALPDGDDGYLSDIRAHMTEEITRTLLHELRPLVGMVESEAKREVETYAPSGTQASLDHLKGFLGALDRLNQVSAAPEIAEFDLSQVVYEAARSVAISTGSHILPGQPVESLDLDAGVSPSILLARNDSVIAFGDPNMVMIALQNVMRNAVEATLEVATDAPVVVNFGVTDRDVWVTVIDEGVGLPSGADRIFEIGRSTKQKGPHQGMGLAITKRALDSLGGGVDLRPRLPRGVECHVSWPFVPF